MSILTRLPRQSSSQTFLLNCLKYLLLGTSSSTMCRLLNTSFFFAAHPFASFSEVGTGFGGGDDNDLITLFCPPHPLSFLPIGTYLYPGMGGARRQTEMISNCRHRRQRLSRRKRIIIRKRKGELNPRLRAPSIIPASCVVGT